ncbi:hypothetical protein DFH06DRAFT_1317645 [Mycena polygramma]|nr:hypothetical protein DFH06DRAFT_1317645 [Mycena polygramma]
MPGPGLRYGPDHYSEDVAVRYATLTIVNNYVLYSTACLLVYELFTSLDDEVTRIWSLKWRLPKILFMLNRYVIRAVLVYVPCLWILADYPGTSVEFCRVYSYWQMIPLRLAILAAQALVVIRVWAIYNNSRRMFWILSILYFCAITVPPSFIRPDRCGIVEVLAVALCVLIATADTQGVAQPPPLSCGLVSRSGYLLKRYASGTWCVSLSFDTSSPIDTAMRIAPVCFEFIMVLITVAKLIPRWTWTRAGGLLGSGGNSTLDVLARDSLIYFGFIFSFSLTNALIYEFSFNAYYHGVLLGPTSAISCIAVSRMMINIRNVPSSPLNHPTSATGMYARTDLSLGNFAVDDDLPDSAHGGEELRHYLKRPLAVAGYGAYKSMPARPTSRDGARHRDSEIQSEWGSVIDIGPWKTGSPMEP